MVDAGTQYSPPTARPEQISTSTPSTIVAGLNISDTRTTVEGEKETESRALQNVSVSPAVTRRSGEYSQPTAAKRHVADALSNDDDSADSVQKSPQSATKRPRGETAAAKQMPIRYELCDPRDLVILISSMLMELIRYNDAIPLQEGRLTRFHSRAPPGISVLDYLQRLTTHATLIPPILLSMVFYIDRLCALYPAFTISSLTVHRFLITSATVASKGLSDSFWTNKTYARVGGVSMKELALLELEFVTRMEWRIVPQPEILVQYYQSLIARSSEFEIDTSGKLDAELARLPRNLNGA